MPTSDELLNRRFEKASFGGYKVSDVDRFMAELADAFSQKNREISELKRRLEKAENKLKEYESEEESLKSALLNAQRLADKIVNEANDEADAIIKEAEEKARSMVSSAKLKVENLMDCAQSEIEMRKQEARRLKQEISDFKLSVMRLYKAHLELINEIPAENSPEPEQEQENQPQTEREEGKAAEETAKEKDDGTNAAPEEKAAEPKETALNDEKEAQEVSKEAEGQNEDPKARFTAQPGRTVYPIKPPGEANKTPEQSEYLPPEVEQARNEAAATRPAVKLNLRYNEKTGEYEPIDGAANGGESEDPWPSRRNRR